MTARSITHDNTYSTEKLSWSTYNNVDVTAVSYFIFSSFLIWSFSFLTEFGQFHSFFESPLVKIHRKH